MILQTILIIIIDISLVGLGFCLGSMFELKKQIKFIGEIDKVMTLQDKLIRSLLAEKLTMLSKQKPEKVKMFKRSK